MNPVLYVAGILFFMMVCLDLWRKEIPSIFGTAIILLLAITNLQNIAFGVLAFIFAWFLYEGGIFKGVADIKMITAIGFLIPAPIGFIALMIVLTMYTLVYNTAMRLILKVKDEYAGTVPIFVAFINLWLTGGFG